MWQMTWDELGAVGIFGPKGFHEEGWIYKRDKCKNGHVVDWRNVT